MQAWHTEMFFYIQECLERRESVYMFSKLSILLLVLPFRTSRSVLYLSVPDLSTSLEKKSLVMFSFGYIHVVQHKITFYKRWLT